MLSVSSLGDVTVLWLDARFALGQATAPIERIHVWDLIARAAAAAHSAWHAGFQALPEPPVSNAPVAATALPWCEDHSYRNDPNQMSLDLL